MATRICKPCDKKAVVIEKRAWARKPKTAMKFISTPKLRGIRVIKAEKVPAYKQIRVRCSKLATPDPKLKITSVVTQETMQS